MSNPLALSDEEKPKVYQLYEQHQEMSTDEAGSAHDKAKSLNNRLSSSDSASSTDGESSVLSSTSQYSEPSTTTASSLNSSSTSSSLPLSERRAVNAERKQLTDKLVRRILQPQLRYLSATRDESSNGETQPVATSAPRFRRTPSVRSTVERSWTAAVTKLLGIGYASEGNAVDVYADGDSAFSEMFAAVDSAQNRVLFETFIWRSDNIGLRMLEKITAAAKRGCEVVVIYDGAGSMSIVKHLQPLIDTGNATVVNFNSLTLFPWQRKAGHSVWFRTHRKILVVDDLVGFAGGMNCTAQYAGTGIGGINTFRDTHMKIRGPAVEHLTRVFIASLEEASTEQRVSEKVRQLQTGVRSATKYLMTPVNRLYTAIAVEGGTPPQRVWNRLKQMLNRVTKPASNTAIAALDTVQRAKDQLQSTRAYTGAQSRLKQAGNRARSTVQAAGASARRRLLPHETRRNAYFTPQDNMTTMNGTPTRITRAESERLERKNEEEAANNIELIRRESEAERQRQNEPQMQRAKSELAQPHNNNNSNGKHVDAQVISSDDTPPVVELATDSDSVGRQESSMSTASSTDLSGDKLPPPGEVFVQVLQSNVVRNTLHIQRVMWTTIEQSVKQILITNPFFIPPHRLDRALTRAAKRGVKIRIITCGQSDTPYMRWAATHMYHKYLELGIDIFEYQERILHAKTVTIDGVYSSVGSFNMDPLSGMKMLELNVAMISSDVSQQLQRQFDSDLPHCQQVTKDSLDERSIFEKLLHWMCYRISRWVSWWFNYEIRATGFED